jgi:hypothetical protein
MFKIKKRIIPSLAILLPLFLFTSCYENYLIITSDFSSPVITADSNKIFFFHYLEASQPPKGISRFPDGGTHYSIYRNVSLYRYDINKKQLTKIQDFGNLPFHQKIDHIALQKNHLVFSLSPLMGWHWIKKYYSDSTYQHIFERYTGFYQYNIAQEKLTRFQVDGFYPELSPDENQIAFLKRDSLGLSLWSYELNAAVPKELRKFDEDSPLNPFVWKDTIHVFVRVDGEVYKLHTKNKTWQETTEMVEFYPNTIPIKQVRELTSDISFSTWGFHLPDYFQKSKTQLIEDIVRLNGNLNYRKAIIQSFAQDFSKDDIEDILKQMNDYENRLDAYEKTEYSLYSKETKELLNKHLK